MKRVMMTIGLASMLAACGTAEQPSDPPASGGEESVEKNIVSGREIIASLEQTATDTTKRDEQATAVKEDETFKDGYMGEPTEELAEDIAVQNIEGFAATTALEEVYGGYEGVNEAGIVFYENQASGADQSGIWFGVKELDERLDEWLAILQKKVDAGEILAEPIYVFQSEHSQKDLEDWSYRASKKLRPMQEANHRPDIANYGIAADTITGALRIEHNFMSEEQQEEFKAAFPDQEVTFEVYGEMVPAPGEPDVHYPEPAIVAELPEEGLYITEMQEEGILVGSTNFYFADADEKLEVGQRVNVESTGMIATSDPGQGTAIVVRVLPAYQPEGAERTDAEVIRQALETSPGEEMRYYTINRVEYDAASGEWLIELNQDGESFEVVLPD
ncbi:DUF3221 domain-containing protein [Planomicrobium sp. YIM 101495]|uniref:DUF3221 domain-containing protein n=1 Tax=Planomicrobium sp. YIM 101495 TaxID=2665160 RepID=UPI0012B81BC2|nr:DUF3221 domain-containing protein [Planomicrobium sp. YIM 101495]MTD31334.1 hypothetical protein [Planomicrobium sp. YIM 101495]